ncbi:P1 family peptidase [Acuticoccus mangrovi]|uniref:P1 family peptidase n=1 Tax=Acuticoccus mangrovi TaxID=2796142 RepID=A0A934ILS0_9HYPH|nr:P1 family peptidase [Acuticoccus mangrovi]MBJ3774683.1 P1 family peptidase [Acuticoccus mangrovi]
MSHILDVPGVRFGHAADPDAPSGVSTLVLEEPGVAGVAVHGGAPGTRETDALAPGRLGPGVDAICLSGGSAFGLASADGVQLALAERGRGYEVRGHRVPIVPGAIVFDLAGPRPDYRALGAASLAAALDGPPDRRLGTVGAGTNAMTAGLKGGFGSASARCGAATVGAAVVVNAVGSVTAADGPWFRAAPFEVDGEFGGLHAPPSADFATIRTKSGTLPRENTVIAIVATDATLTNAEANRLAIAAHDGLALAIYPSHTLLDGDTLFAVSTGKAAAPERPLGHVALAATAAAVLARAVARGVYSATPGASDRFPTWQSLYG